MPHVVYLHSALTQHRIVTREPRLLRRLFRFQLIDVLVAMTLAGAINAAMLIMAATTFHAAGLSDIATIEEAHKTLQPLLGSAASTIFAISLLAAGLSSATVGTMAGQVVMQGFIRRSIPLWLRRAITMLPTLVIIGIGADPTQTLVISQVVLSFGIPFALVPLVMFTCNRKIMGDVLVNRKITTVIATGIAGLILALNFFLLWDVFIG
jgi:manganese transport protein